MISFQPGRTHSIPGDSSLLARRWSVLDDPAVSYRHAVLAISSSLLPFVRSLQNEIEALERERDALLFQGRTPGLPEHLDIPMPLSIEVKSRVEEVPKKPLLFFDDDD